MTDTHFIPVDRLTDAVRIVVRGFGSSDDEVEAVASNLIEANLTGHDSHGIGMLPRYADNYLAGGLKPNTHVRVELDGGSVLRLDGGSGFGQVIGHETMELGIARTRENGSCIVALGRAHHLGRIGAWAEQAAAAGMVSLHFVNVVTRAIVAPHGGSDARFGTNPFCAGVPITGRDPVIVDFATSVVAQGKTRVAHNKGEMLAPDCVIDHEGHATRDPRYTVVPPFGALLTFGSYKGFGLALMCELLGGAQAAGLTQRDDDIHGRLLNGMLSVLIDPDAIANREAFEHEAQAFIDWVKASPPREGFEGVLIAGEPERAARARRAATGIPVDGTTWADILTAATRLGVDADAVSRAAGLG